MGPGGHPRNGTGQKGLKRVFALPRHLAAETYVIPESSGPQTLAGRGFRALKIPEGPPRQDIFQRRNFSTISDSRPVS